MGPPLVPLCEGRSCLRARLAKHQELFAECIYCRCIIYELEGFDHHLSLPEAGTEGSGGWSCKLDGALLLSSQQSPRVSVGIQWQEWQCFLPVPCGPRAAEAALAATPTGQGTELSLTGHGVKGAGAFLIGLAPALLP